MRASPEPLPGPRRAKRLSTVGGVALLILVGLAAGCRARAVIPMRELPRLDGYHRGEIRPIRTLDGRTYLMNPRTVVALRMQDGSRQRFVFSHIRVTPDELQGTTVHGWQVRLRLEDIGEVWVGHRRPGAIVGLVFLGIAAFILTIIIIVNRLGP